MATTLWSSSTYSGYNYDEAISALQKEIRRGSPDGSFWALEIFFIGEGAVRTNLWNRLLVIAVEDIGPADPLPILEVLSLFEQSRDDPLSVATAARLMASSKKTRMTDWSYLAMRNRFRKSAETELDPNTLQERLRTALRQKEINEILYYTAALFETEQPVVGRRFRKAWYLIPEAYLEEMNRWGYVTTLSRIWSMESWKCSEKSALLFSHLAWLFVLDRIPPFEEIKISSDPRLNEEVERVREKMNLLPVPDYALDKHTREGRKKGRDWRHFLEIASRIENIDDEYEALSNEYRKLM